MSVDRCAHEIEVDTTDPIKAAQDIIEGIDPMIIHLLRKHEAKGMVDFFTAIIGEIAGRAAEALDQPTVLAMLVLVGADVINTESASESLH